MADDTITKFKGPGQWRSQAARLEAAAEAPPEPEPEELSVTGRLVELARSAKAQAKRRGSSRSIGQRDPSLRWPHLYDILRSQGKSKSAAARISNAHLPKRKGGRLFGLPYQQADNPAALAKVREEQRRKRRKKR